MKLKYAVVVQNSFMEEFTKELGEVLKPYIDSGEMMIEPLDDAIFSTHFGIDCECLDIDMSDDTFIEIAKDAHKDRLTFNEEVTKILSKKIKSIKGEKEDI